MAKTWKRKHSELFSVLPSNDRYYPPVDGIVESGFLACAICPNFLAEVTQ